MPEIEIRPAVATDIKQLMAFDHSGDSDYVWQLETSKDAEQIDVSFRRIRLPRTVRVYYPRTPTALADEWKRSSLMLVAVLAGMPAAYLRIDEHFAPETIWVTDLVVAREQRRKGLAAALLLSAQQWGVQRNLGRIVVETTSKNYGMIALAQKLGFEFSGYHNQYYPSRDIALFFSRLLR